MPLVKENGIRHAVGRIAAYRRPPGRCAGFVLLGFERVIKAQDPRLGKVRRQMRHVQEPGHLGVDRRVLVSAMTPRDLADTRDPLIPG